MNKFAHVPFDMDAHWELIVKWFSERKFPCPDPRFLPPTGFVVLYDNEPVVCGFLFKTDANACVFGNLVGDPNADKVVRSDAMDYLMILGSMVAQQGGFGMICCSTNLPHLAKRFESLGFEKTDINLSAFRRILCQ